MTGPATAVSLRLTLPATIWSISVWLSPVTSTSPRQIGFLLQHLVCRYSYDGSEAPWQAITRTLTASLSRPGGRYTRIIPLGSGSGSDQVWSCLIVWGRLALKSPLVMSVFVWVRPSSMRTGVSATANGSIGGMSSKSPRIKDMADYRITQQHAGSQILATDQGPIQWYLFCWISVPVHIYILLEI